MDGLEVLRIHIRKELLHGESQHFLFQAGVQLGKALGQYLPLLRQVLLGRSHAHERTGGHAASHQRLAVIHLLLLNGRYRRVLGVQLVQDAGVVGRESAEALLENAAPRNHVKAVHARLLAFVQFTHVGKGEEVVGVLHANSRIGIHPLAGNLHLAAAQAVLGRPLHVNLLLDLGGRCIALRTARIAYDHGEVAFPVPLPANGQMSRRAQRLPVLVNAVQGKIGLVLRPLPVVLVSAEGRHRHRRRPHQAYVGIHIIQAHIVLGTGPHAGKPGFHAILLLVFRLHDGGNAP